MIKVGCCGFPEAKGKYYQEFKVVEVQQSFYQLPKLRTAQKWREQAPDDFEFTLKAWQLITHLPSSPTYRRLQERIPVNKKQNYGFFKPTREIFQAWERTVEIAHALKAKIIVFQCPASFRPTKENKQNLKKFFNSIKRDGYSVAWEPRGKWTPEEVEGLCRELDLIHCVDPFKDEPVYGDIRYYRLHGIGGYRYKYTDEDLENLKAKCPEGVETYCMFNNVSMLEDARRFSEIRN